MADTYEPLRLAALKVTANKHGYRGVNFLKRENLFVARIGTNRGGGHRRYLGRFKSAEDAAQAYDRAAVEMYGEQARVNFPLKGEVQVLQSSGAKHCAYGHLLAKYKVTRGSGKIICGVCHPVLSAEFKMRMAAFGFELRWVPAHDPLPEY